MILILPADYWHVGQTLRRLAEKVSSGASDMSVFHDFHLRMAAGSSFGPHQTCI